MKAVYILLLALVLAGAGLLVGRFPLSFYSTAYQGVRAYFYGVRVLQPSLAVVNGIWGELEPGFYRNGVFDTTLLWDGDDPDYYLPNLEGEMTPVIVPEDSLKAPEWVPQDWRLSDSYTTNPRRVWEWNVTLDNGTVISYRMEEWVLKWYVSVEAGWDSFGHGWGDPPEWNWYESDNKRYRNIELWFKIDVNDNNWYFENQPDKVFFAVAKIEVAHLRRDGLDVGRIDVTPESIASVLPIYLDSPDKGWLEEFRDLTENILSFKGEVLNPTYFRRAVYTKIILNDFGTQEVYEFPTSWKAKGDVVTYGFNVYVFVIGEWKTKDIGEIPGDYGRIPKNESEGFSLPEALGRLFGNPWFWLGIGGLLIVIAFIAFAGSSLVSGVVAGLIARKK